jgi:hypothetical protein
MIGFAVSENFFSKVDSKELVVQKVQSTLKSSPIIAAATIIDSSLQVQKPKQLEVVAPDSTAETVQEKPNKVSVEQEVRPVKVIEQLPYQPEIITRKAVLKKLVEPLPNTAEKNVFREIDRSSQAVHSSVKLSASTAAQIRPIYNNYNGDDSIGADGQIVLDGDEYTINPRPLKRKKTSDNNNGLRQETYTYYRSTTNRIQPTNEKNTNSKSVEPVLSFIGTLLNGKANGYGVGTYANGNTYKGNWRDNSKEGYGTYIWKNGEEYRGSYKNDLRNGYGKMYNKSGQLIQEGYWENDAYIK